MAINTQADDDRTALLARAEAAMAAACVGYRTNRRCVDDAGNRRLHPHPTCLHAKYRHDLILLQHGVVPAVSYQPHPATQAASTPA